MQFQGRLKFLYGQKKKAASGATLPPQLALFCVAVPLLLPSITEMKMKSLIMRNKHKAGVIASLENKAKGGPGTEAQSKMWYNHISCPDMIYNAENHTKTLNNGENRLPVFRVLTKEDQWVWVQTNAQLVYRNGCPECVIVSQQAANDKEDGIKKHGGTGGMSDGGEVLLLNCSNTMSGQLRHHTPWTPVTKDEMKHKMEMCKNEGFYTQEEPLNFCKTSMGGQKAHGVENPWTMRLATGPIRAGQNINHLPSRVGKSSHFGKPGAYKMSPNCHNGRMDGGLAKLYSNLQNPDMDGYCTEGIKTENSYMPHAECYDTHMLSEAPIKIEQDSDSENGCDMYGMPQNRGWMCKEHVDKRYSMGYAEGVQLKTEADYYEQYSPCQKNKAAPQFNGHYQNMCAGNRPLKCVLNKDLAHFSPQRLSHSDTLGSNQSANCMDSHMYGNSAMDHKSYVQQDYKLTYEFKSHQLVHSIKREPMDSPPWSDGNQDIIQTSLQRNIMPNCVMNSGAHKSNPYAYLQ